MIILDIIVDATHLTPKYESQIRELVGNRADVIIKDFTDVPLETCISNDLKRPNSVGSVVIQEMYEKTLKKEPVKKVIEYDPALPDAIMVDMDGTLANIDWRNPYDASECDKDGVYNDVVELVDALHQNDEDLNIIIVSGRMNKFRFPTVYWLNKNLMYWDLLLMRETDDYRKDFIIKEEIYNDNIKGKYNVKLVLDDRNQVVNMWRSLGLRCLQVDEGNF